MVWQSAADSGNPVWGLGKETLPLEHRSTGLEAHDDRVPRPRVLRDVRRAGRSEQDEKRKELLHDGSFP